MPLSLLTLAIQELLLTGIVIDFNEYDKARESPSSHQLQG